MRIPFEIEHGIHNVFQDARPGQRAIFGHMAYKEQGNAALFGKTRELRGTLPDLCHRTRRRGERIRP